MTYIFIFNTASHDERMSIKMNSNYIIEGDSLEILKKINKGTVDIVITSPPYNAAHDYDSYDDNLNDDIYKKTWKIYLRRFIGY